MTSELQRKVEYAKNIKQHLAVLSRLAGRTVSPDDLMDVESTRVLRERLKLQPVAPFKGTRIPFAALRTEPFRKFIGYLAASAPTPVHVWIDTTAACGVLTLGSLLEFNFAFDFEDEPSGTIVIRTADLANRMLFDFSEDEDGRSLELEWGGLQWYEIEFPALL